MILPQPKRLRDGRRRCRDTLLTLDSTAFLQRGSVVVVGFQVSQNYVCDLTKSIELFLREKIDHVIPYRTKVRWGRSGDGTKTFSGQYDHCSSGIVRYFLSPNHSSAFHSQDLVRKPGLRPFHVVSQSADAPPALFGLDQIGKDRVVGHRQPGLIK